MSPGARLTPLVAGLLWAACAPSGPPTPPPATDGFLVSGCSDWDAQGVCQAEGPLTVWVESSTAARPRIEATGYTTSEPTRALGGHRFTLTPTATTGPTLDTVVRVEGIPRLGVQRRAARPKLDPKLLEGKTADDLALLLPTLSPSARLELLAAAHSRIAPVAGPVRDRLLRQGILLAEGLERRQQRTVFRFVVAQSRLQQGDLAGSEAELKAGQQADARDGLALIWMAYAEAQLARQRADATGALRFLMDLKAWAERLSQPYAAWVADQVALPLLRQGGFHQRAAAIEMSLLEGVERLPCDRREGPLTNVGWARLMAREQQLNQQGSRFGEPTPPDETTRILEMALRAYSECQHSKYNAALNLLLDALQRNDIGRAKHWQAVAHAEPIERIFLAWDRLLSARLDLQAGELRQAEQGFEALVATPGVEPRVLVEAHLGLALSLQALGKVRSVREALDTASEVLDHLPRDAADLGAAEQHANLELLRARISVDVLASSGQSEAAFQASWQAQRRIAAATALGRRAVLSPSMQAERDAKLQRYYVHRTAAAKKRAELWSAPTVSTAALAREIDEEERRAVEALNDALGQAPPEKGPAERPPAGGVQVLLHPGLDRWWGFARDASKTVAVSIPTSSVALDVSAARILAALPIRLDSYREVQALLAGAARNLSLQALPYGGTRLGLLAPITYGVSHPSSPEPMQGEKVLLLGDNRINLSSGREIGEINELLVGRGTATLRPAIETLTLETLSGLLGQSKILHFAGHAERSEAALRTGLRLRDDMWLTASDVVALPSIPRTVVLSGCDTSRHRVEDAGWSMADAFLIAGAQEVVGTEHTVEGELARNMMYRFYNGEGPAAQRLFRATAEVASETPTADWAAFRIMVPAGKFSANGFSEPATPKPPSLLDPSQTE